MGGFRGSLGRRRGLVCQAPRLGELFGGRSEIALAPAPWRSRPRLVPLRPASRQPRAPRRPPSRRPALPPHAPRPTCSSAARCASATRLSTSRWRSLRIASRRVRASRSTCLALSTFSRASSADAIAWLSASRACSVAERARCSRSSTESPEVGNASLIVGAGTAHRVGQRPSDAVGRRGLALGPGGLATAIAPRIEGFRQQPGRVPGQILDARCHHRGGAAPG